MALISSLVGRFMNSMCKYHFKHTDATASATEFEIIDVHFERYIFTKRGNALSYGVKRQCHVQVESFRSLHAP